MTASIFQTLLAIDVHKWVEKKDKFPYLSWSYAVAELRKVDPTATWDVIKFPLPEHAHVLAPYCITPAGCFVEVAVIVGGVRLSQVHPVLDQRNAAIKAPTADQVNKSIMRCLVKAIALHGLGLNIYAGEDLPLGDGGDDEKQPAKAATPPAKTEPTQAELITKTKKAIVAELRRLGTVVLADDADAATKSKAQADAAEAMRQANDGKPPKDLGEFMAVLLKLERVQRTNDAQAA